MSLLKRLLQRHNGFITSLGEIRHLNPFSQTTIYKNIKRDYKNWKKVALDVDKVSVGKTSDTNDYTISFVNSKGEKATLWLNGDKVRSITPY